VRVRPCTWARVRVYMCSSVGVCVRVRMCASALLHVSPQGTVGTGPGLLSALVRLTRWQLDYSAWSWQSV
jgi:hypothetical protein